MTASVAALETPDSPVQVAVKLPVAAKLLGISPDTFNRHVRPRLKLLHVGETVLVTLTELRRFADENSHHPLD